MFPPSLNSYHDKDIAGIWAVLLHRAQTEPLDGVVTVIFVLAIAHTFLAPKIQHLSHQLQQERVREQLAAHVADQGWPQAALRSIPVAILHLLGEVEVIFGLWVIPLAVVIGLCRGLGTFGFYLIHSVRFKEPLFVVVVMAIAASGPVIQFASRCLGMLAGNSPARWWLTLLTVGPLLGSIITEPAAMTICALLLGREFYRLNPSPRFMYATLGLLFVNISVGGALTNFAAPPVLIVAAQWHWSTFHMLGQFGIRTLPGILIATAIYFAIFRSEFTVLARNRSQADAAETTEAVPPWIIFTHLVFLAWTVLVAHQPLLFIGGFLVYLIFITATARHQGKRNLRSPILVGFFLIGLVIHGGLQAWWIEPVLGRLSALPLFLGATILTAFNDNALITFLATLVPNLDERLKDAAVAGAICGGGLTVIANAPNPAGQSLLQKDFPKGVSPIGLFLGALGPTLIMAVIFALP